MTSVAVPSLSRLWDSPEDYRRAYLRMLEKIAFLTMPGVAIMIATSDWVVAIILGPQWREVGKLLGILGVVGPRRLPYPDVISAVEETARQVTEALSRVRQDLYLPS